MVSPVTFRPASVLAKNAVTVDDISGGRVELGIGAGWYEAEHEAYGFPFPPTGKRFDELERQLEEIHREWSPESDAWPKPVQQPRPPIIVGGSAKPRAVRAAVRVGRRVQHGLSLARGRPRPAPRSSTTRPARRAASRSSSR